VTGDRSALEQRVNELEQELALMKRKLEVDAETEAAKPVQALVSAGSDGFSIRSPTRSTAAHPRLHALRRAFLHDATGEPRAGLRHLLLPAHPPDLRGYTGWCRRLPDHAGLRRQHLVVQDAWANLRYLPEAQLQLGKYKGPSASSACSRRPRCGSSSARCPRSSSRTATWASCCRRDREGIFKLSARLDERRPRRGVERRLRRGNDKDLIARVFFNPFQDAGIPGLQGLGVGFASSYGHEVGTPGTFKTTGQQTFFAFRSGVLQDGSATRYSPQAYWYWGPVGLLTEYVQSSREYSRPGFANIRADDSAWQVALAWAITGENESYKGLLPSSSFDPYHGTWGAFELITRFSH